MVETGTDKLTGEPRALVSRVWDGDTVTIARVGSAVWLVTALPGFQMRQDLTPEEAEELARHLQESAALARDYRERQEELKVATEPPAEQPAGAPLEHAPEPADSQLDWPGREGGFPPPGRAW